jgi:TetR/AcrR family transcriptional regulator, cholesterol catabolism regulator
MLGVIGMCNYLFRWYRPEGRLTPSEIADELTELVMKGVRSGG